MEPLEYVVDHLREIGIRENLFIVDFGCGKGNYTIPIAQIVSKEGKVFAFEKEISKLEQLLKRAIESNVDGIIVTHQDDSHLESSLDPETIDMVMLYNVSCCIIGQDKYSEFHELVKRFYRVTKKQGKLVIGIKEGKTMLNRIETAIPVIADEFKLEKKEKGKYFDGEKLRYGLFYTLSKR